MSFAFMPVYTGDYLRDTQHLSMSEHGAYFKMLMYCWDQQAPLPSDERRLMGICNARSTDEIEAMRRVISEFFVPMADGLYNKRMSEEIARAEQISSARRKGGLEKARRTRDAVRNAQAMLKHSTSSAPPGTPTPTPTLTPTTTTTPLPPDPPSSEGLGSNPETREKKITRAKRAAVLAERPDDVAEQVWNDWQALRKAKRAPVTLTVVQTIRREAEKAHTTLENALRVCCRRGWTGFEAAWVERTPQRMTNAEKTAKAYELVFGKEMPT